MMENDSNEIFRKLKKDITEYVELKFELLKLNTYERTGKVIAVLSYSLILLSLVFFVILFIFLALGFYLGEMFHSLGAGFGVVAIFYLIMIFITLKIKIRIVDMVMNIVISALNTSDKEDKEEKYNIDKDERRETNATSETY